jgi:glucose/arabinose dehydrogenase
VSLGKIYTGNAVSEQSWWRAGMEMPVVFWMPAISPSGLMFYTGDRFPLWKGHLFVGGMSGQQLQRIAFDQPPPQAERRESMLTQLGVRIRDVRQGPDGYIYIATEEPTNGPGSTRDVPTGTVLRIEPAE